MLYAELWTEGNPSGYSDLVYDRTALEKAVPPLAQLIWKFIVPT